jgi:hypothetical protein
MSLTLARSEVFFSYSFRMIKSEKVFIHLYEPECITIRNDYQMHMTLLLPFLLSILYVKVEIIEVSFFFFFSFRYVSSQNLSSYEITCCVAKAHLLGSYFFVV